MESDLCLSPLSCQKMVLGLIFDLALHCTAGVISGVCVLTFFALSSMITVALAMVAFEGFFCLVVKLSRFLPR